MKDKLYGGNERYRGKWVRGWRGRTLVKLSEGSGGDPKGSRRTIKRCCHEGKGSGR